MIFSCYACWANYGAAVLILKEKEWFMPYVEKWLWFNRINDDLYEDLAAYYKKEGLIPS